MYDKLFFALEENGIGKDRADLLTPTAQMRRDGTSLHHSSSKDLGSTSGSLFGAQAVESMQRRYAEQIQQRSEELETKLKNKEQVIEEL